MRATVLKFFQMNNFPGDYQESRYENGSKEGWGCLGIRNSTAAGRENGFHVTEVNYVLLANRKRDDFQL